MGFRSKRLSRLFPRLAEPPSPDDAQVYLQNAKGFRRLPFDQWIDRRVTTAPRRPPKVLED